MVEGLDDGHGAAGGDLAGQHQLQALAGFFGDGGDHAQDILHRIAEAQAVPLAVIDQAGGARPGEGDQAVVQPPDVDGVVEFLIRCLDHQAAQFVVPVIFQFLQFDRGAFQ